MHEQVKQAVTDFNDTHGKKLSKTGTKVIADITETTKAMTTPSFTCHDDKEAYVAVYNKAHKKPKPSTQDIEGFGAPAFAIEGEVHIFTGAPDWLKTNKVNVRKIQSTMVHEAFHANSHHGKGVQDADERSFHGPGSYCYMDEVITDLFSYVTYTRMKLATDNHYESGYVQPKGSGAVGVADGSWISLAFALPAFDGKRKQILLAYFSGGPLTGVDIDLQTNLKVLKSTTAASPKYGMPFTLQAYAPAAQKLVDNGLLPLCGIKGYALPVAHSDTLVNLVKA